MKFEKIDRMNRYFLFTWDYGVILKSSRDDNYNRPGQDLSAYKYVKPTNLVLNKMKTLAGIAWSVSEFHGIVSPAYITCELDIRQMYFQDIYIICYGATITFMSITDYRMVRKN